MDDDFDMFAIDESLNDAKNTNQTTFFLGTEVKHVDDLADAEGYFRAPAGTTLSSYIVQGELGKGVFSTVYYVKKNGAEYAAKVLRANEIMHKAGEKELNILKQIGFHPHIVQLVDSFELESSTSKIPHLVLIFERMEMNLRETLNKFGKNTGISLEGVRNFGRQLFSCFARLRELGIVHADLKPDNILVSSDLRKCAVGDFGSAFYLTDPEAAQPTPYLVSRYYRSPEIILGLEYGCESDIWSLGVTLFELFTGTVLFPGETNSDMLALFQKRIGRFPKAMIRRHISSYVTKLEKEPHFNSKTLKFKLFERDSATNMKICRLVKAPDHPFPKEALKSLILEKAEELDENLLGLTEVIEACLKLDPQHRIDPRKAETTFAFFHDADSKRDAKRMKIKL